MDITIRIYTTHQNHKSSRSIKLNEGDLDEIIAAYLKKEEYTKDGETIDSIGYEHVGL